VAEIEASLQALPNRKTEAVRAVRREFSRRLATHPPKTVFHLALQLLERDSPVTRFTAYELIHYHHGALHSLRARDLDRLGRGMDSWGDVDTFACYLSGPAWREGQVTDALIHRWARSQDRWWRRTALVSTVPLNNKARGGQGDTARTLEVCRRLVADRDDMVVKAMSWALRALAVRNPQAVRRFLHEHRPVLAARVEREVMNKLTTGLKNPKVR